MENTTQHAARSTEKRVFESRAIDARPVYSFGGGSRFNVPEEIRLADPDHKYAFVVYSSGNFEQKENYYDALDRGYMPVPTSEHPRLSRAHFASPFAREEREDNLYKVGGQILVKRPNDVDKAEKEHFDGDKARQEHLSEMYLQPDARYPKPFMDQRTRVRIH